MVNISCSTKFHAFALAEQLAKNELLNKFYTLYYSKRNKFYNPFHPRIDKEQIPIELVKTFPFYLPIFFYWKDYHRRAVLYDWLVSNQLKKYQNYKIFIGWSSMSLLSAQQAKKDGKIVLIERGSSHILTQNILLKEEYKRFGIEFNIDERIIKRELKEYDIADYIVIPSDFVYKSFIANGISADKLFKNPYGVSSYFRTDNFKVFNHKFRILYLGGLNIRKGLIYLFDALDKLSSIISDFEIWFIGSVAPELVNLIESKKKDNWIFWGHINHYDLLNYITQCDIAVQPSIEEGLSMVIPQMLASGVPVISTTNTGGSEYIEDAVNGYIIPIRNSEVIKDKILELFNDRKLLNQMKVNAAKLSDTKMSWDRYGKQYSDFIKKIIK